MGLNYLIIDIVVILRIICSKIFLQDTTFAMYTNMAHIITYIIFNTLLLFLGVFGIVGSAKNNESFKDNKVILVILTFCIIADIIGCTFMIISDELQEMFFMWSI